MNQILILFNNRELALITWFLIIFFFSLTKSKAVLDSLIGLLLIYFSKRILIVNILCWLYLVVIINVAYLLDVWNVVMIKDTIIWTIISSIILIVNSDRKDKSTLIGVVKSTVQPLVGIEFIVNLESFSFFWEMLLLPVLVFIYAGADIASKDPKQKQVERYLKGLQVIFGIFILYSSISNIFTGYGTFDGHQYSMNLLMPIWLTISFIPCLYLIIVYREYEKKKIRQEFRRNKRKWT